MRAGVEVPAECCDAAMGMGLDRPDADTEFLGDFEFGKVGEIPQRHDIALATAQRRQQTLQIDAVSDGGLEPGVVARRVVGVVGVGARCRAIR